jgi:hypothetical protein
MTLRLRTSTQWLAAAGLAALLGLPAATPVHSQSPSMKKSGQIVCGSFSGDPKKHPAWNDTMEIEIEAGALTATPSRAKGQVMRGTVGPSGTILVAGEGGSAEGAAEWTYEFQGKLNPKGPTVIRGQLADIKGGPAKRSCSISF